MDEKKMVYIIVGLLAAGCIGVLFMIIPWITGRGFSNWKESLINDGLILGVLVCIGYGIYVGTQTHKK